jgi:fructokinase
MIPEFKNNKVICIGEVLWDNLLGRAMPGGALLNVARHLHNSNIPVTLISKVGADAKGIELLGYMKDAGLNTEGIYFDESLPTSEADINIDRFKNIKYSINEAVAWDNLHINMRIVDHAGTAGAIVYGSLASRDIITRKAIDVLLNFDIVKIMNVNLRPPFVDKDMVEGLLLKADIVKLNENELEQIVSWNNKFGKCEKDKLQWFSEHYKCQIICVTKGKNGAVVYHNDILYTHPGYKTETVNNVGTGAAFIAGFISSLINGSAIKQSLDEACLASAAVASLKGTFPNNRYRKTNKFLKSQKTTTN